MPTTEADAAGDTPAAGKEAAAEAAAAGASTGDAAADATPAKVPGCQPAPLCFHCDRCRGMRRGGAMVALHYIQVRIAKVFLTLRWMLLRSKRIRRVMAGALEDPGRSWDVNTVSAGSVCPHGCGYGRVCRDVTLVPVFCASGWRGRCSISGRRRSAERRSQAGGRRCSGAERQQTRHSWEGGQGAADRLSAGAC